MSKAGVFLQQLKKLPTIQFPVGGGHGKPSLLFIHGANRELQNAEYWAPQLSWLDKRGHGVSIPGPDGEKVSTEKQVNALAQFISSDNVTKPVVLVGRSYGGKVAVQLAKKIPSLIQSLILIAPAVEPADVQTLPEELKNRPILCVAAEDDNVIPFSRTEQISKTLPKGKLYNAGKVITDQSQSWVGHCPEMVNPDQFGKEVQNFVDQL